MRGRNPQRLCIGINAQRAGKVIFDRCTKRLCLSFVQGLIWLGRAQAQSCFGRYISADVNQDQSSQSFEQHRAFCTKIAQGAANLRHQRVNRGKVRCVLCAQNGTPYGVKAFYPIPIISIQKFQRQADHIANGIFGKAETMRHPGRDQQNRGCLLYTSDAADE